MVLFTIKKKKCTDSLLYTVFEKYDLKSSIQLYVVILFLYLFSAMLSF